MRVDAFASVFSLNVYKFPQTVDPPAAAPVEQLLITMGVNGVDGAVIVQPPHYGPDHSYLRAALQMYPEKVRAVCAAGSPDIDCRGVIGARYGPADLAAHAESGQRTLDAGKLIYLAAPADVSSLRGGKFFLETARSEITGARLEQLRSAVADPRIGILVVGGSRPAPDFADALAQLRRSLGSSRLAWGSGFPDCGGSEGYAAAIEGLRDLGGYVPFNPADSTQESQ